MWGNMEKHRDVASANDWNLIRALSWFMCYNKEDKLFQRAAEEGTLVFRRERMVFCYVENAHTHEQ